MRWDGGSACSVCCDAELLVRLSSMDLHCAARANRAPRVTGETTHAAPADRLGQTWCCGLTPFELPVTHRMTDNPAHLNGPGCRPGAVLALSVLAMARPVEAGDPARGVK